MKELTPYDFAAIISSQEYHEELEKIVKDNHDE